MQNLNDSITKYDTAKTECQENLKIINSTMAQLSRNVYTNEDRIAMEHTKIEQLDFEITHDRVILQNINDSMTKLKFDRILDHVVVQNINTSISKLELEGKSFRDYIEMFNISINKLEINSANHQTDLQNLCINISNLEKVGSFTEMLNSTVTQLQVDTRLQIKASRDQNLTLTHLREDMEIQTALIGNMSEMLSVLNADRQSDIVTIRSNSDRLSQLGRDINETTDLHHSLALRASYLEGKILVKNKIALSSLMGKSAICVS